MHMFDPTDKITWHRNKTKIECSHSYQDAENPGRFFIDLSAFCTAFNIPENTMYSDDMSNSGLPEILTDFTCVEGLNFKSVDWITQEGLERRLKKLGYMALVMTVKSFFSMVTQMLEKEIGVKNPSKSRNIFLSNEHSIVEALECEDLEERHSDQLYIKNLHTSITLKEGDYIGGFLDGEVRVWKIESIFKESLFPGKGKNAPHRKIQDLTATKVQDPHNRGEITELFNYLHKVAEERDIFLKID